MSNKRRVLFYRDLRKLSSGTNGANIKVRDYLEYVKLSPFFSPHVYFSKQTEWFDNPGNVWNAYRATALKEWVVLSGDIIFLYGNNWEILPPEQRISSPVPIINVVQPRHARTNDPRHNYLKYKAIRFTNSETGKNILLEANVNGPLFTIPVGIDTNMMPKRDSNQDIDILIVGLKQPKMAKVLARAMETMPETQNFNIHVQTRPKLPTREDFLALLNRATVSIFLPLKENKGSEGFYMPALEGMALGNIVICPDSVGNRNFCIDGYNCIMPEYTIDGILAAIKYALQMPAHEINKLLMNSETTVKKHTIKQECEKFLELLHNTDNMWKGMN